MAKSLLLHTIVVSGSKASDPLRAVLINARDQARFEIVLSVANPFEKRLARACGPHMPCSPPRVH